MKRKLSEAAKVFAVTRLACLEPPASVAAAIKTDFGVEITPQSVEAYDPTKAAGKNLAPRFRSLFAATQERFFTEFGNIGAAHRSVRIRRLERMANRAESDGNLALSASLLAQIARECGGTI